MALNYSIAIHTIDENGNNIGDAKIHAYFKKNNSSSSASKWNGTIKRTAGNGKTSFNLGDGSFLTSEGKIDNGDEILISAWLTDNNDTSIDDKSTKAPGITRCVNFVHTINIDSSSYAEDFTLLLVKNPICNFNIPSVSNTGHSFTIENNSYISNGPFSDGNRDDLYQELSHFNQDLFLGLEIEKTNYNLDETTEDKDGIENYSYSYIDAGDYNCTFTVSNYYGISCFVNKSYHILYNKPSINFDYTFTKLLNSDKHIGVGNDDELKISQLSSTNFGDTWTQIQATFDWYIYDLDQNGTDNSDTYNAKNENFEPTKLYKSSSADNDKNIRLSINWNDGFDSHTETLEKVPYLDEYKIKQNYSWITQKGYQNNGVYVPLGDDDLISIEQSNTDNASEDYNSNSQWKEILWTVQKKKNDGSDDNEELSIIKSNNDDYNSLFEFFVRYLHDIDDKVQVNQKLTYWDGWKDIIIDLSKSFVTQNYIINHNYHWSTERYGDNKVIINDNDKVQIINDTTFSPQDNQDIVQEDKYNVTKDKYTSYTDENIVSDNEEFIYSSGNLTNTPEFYVKKDGNFNVLNTITYYDGYETKISTSSKTLKAEVLTPNPKFKWISREGTNKTIIGRDDTVTFINESTVSDYYDTEYSKTGSRNLSINWFIHNFVTAGNFSNPDTIGGAVYDSDDDLVQEFINQEMTDKPEINFWTAKNSQKVKMNFSYNDGYFNRSIDLSKNIKTQAYSDLVPNASYTSSVPDRNTDITFIDNSTNNETRIIDEDWSLTDRYEDNSMTTDKQGEDNLQTWFNVSRDTEITTRVNSNEDHTIKQDIIRWDDGFKLKTFTNSYVVTTSAYSISPGFIYDQIFVTGPEIEFSCTSTKNEKAVLLTYDLEIEDKNNDGSDAFASYQNNNLTDKIQHIYKSCSNSPFEADIANKEVTLFQDYDDGWNRVYDSYTENIIVKPNRISQDFLLNPIRHSADTKTEDNTITGNNPIEFHDSSDTDRIDENGNKDYNFITEVNYLITEDCES